MPRMTKEQTAEREKEVMAWIADGLGIREIANNLGVRQEAVRKFLKVRGWETKGMKEYREAQSNSAD